MRTPGTTRDGHRAPAAAPAEARPGDEAAPGTPGTGEGLCPDCGGRGSIDGHPCPACGGTGIVVLGVGGA
ncbi:hypothetical protein J5J86_22580 [Aquabacter sp. L1I39]|uniref:hypothetical protein n=1 Tax=Aquabacter sp. L1I39 TaxID=2820278 RepID=UPI001ADACF6B|nr:hypothetical protein [Aquabacter sp. L1I39]QTL06300.1 hypothetical protein J5J86_22580 [Aquabacter sp. L1I39]